MWIYCDRFNRRVSADTHKAHPRNNVTHPHTHNVLPSPWLKRGPTLRDMTQLCSDTCIEIPEHRKPIVPQSMKLACENILYLPLRFDLQPGSCSSIRFKIQTFNLDGHKQKEQH